MKHLLIILLLCAPALQANQKAQGFCQVGGQVVVTQGLNSVTNVQASYKSCTVTVYFTGTTNRATIYSDNAGTPLANPFTATTQGLWGWYSINGRYDVTISGAGIPGGSFTFSDILLNDVQVSPLILDVSPIYLDTCGSYAALTYLPSIYPFGVTSSTTQCHDFTGAGATNFTYNSFTALGIADVPNGGVVGGWLGGLARANGSYVTGANILALSPPGVVAPKLVGIEVDYEPSNGTTTSGAGGGIFINVFNGPQPVPGIFLGGVGGGTWANGIGMTDIAAAGSGLFVSTGSPAMAAFINTTQGTFNDDAILLGSLQGISFANTASGFARIWNDGSNNLRIVTGATGFVNIRNPADNANTGSLNTGEIFLTPTFGIDFPNTSSGYARIWNDGSNNLRIVPGTTGDVNIRNPADNATTGSLALGLLFVNVGVNNASPGFQHVRQNTCLVGSTTQWDTCLTTVTWPGTFADTNYTATCSVEMTTANPIIVQMYAKSTTSIGVEIANFTAAAAQGVFDCIGVHQ